MVKYFGTLKIFLQEVIDHGLDIRNDVNGHLPLHLIVQFHAQAIMDLSLNHFRRVYLTIGLLDPHGEITNHYRIFVNCL